MEPPLSDPSSSEPRATISFLTIVLLTVALALGGVIGWVGTSAEQVDIVNGLPVFGDAPGLSYRAVTLGEEGTTTPWSNTAAGVANVQIVDVDGDGANDILVCDAVRHS